MIRPLSPNHDRRAAALALLLAVAPFAAGAESVRGKQAGDIVLGLSAIAVLPANNGGKVTAIGGTPWVGTDVTAQLDLTWFATPMLALNMNFGAAHNRLRVDHTMFGRLELGTVRAVAPTISVQLHPFPAAAFSPYIGSGLNIGLFWRAGGTRAAMVTSEVFRPSFGPAVNLGIDYEVTPALLLNLDAKLALMRPEVSINRGAVRGRALIDPWIIGAGIRYRF